MVPSHGAEGLIEAWQCFFEVVCGDGEGGGDAEDVFAGGVDDESGGECGLDDGAGVGGVEFDAQEEASAADLLDFAGIFERGECFDDAFAFLGGLGGEVFLFEDVEDGGGDGGADRVAAEGAAVGAGLEERGEAGFGEHAGDGDAAAERFAEGHDVGDDPPAVAVVVELVSEVGAGTSAAGPDFIEDEGEVVLIAEGANAGEEVGIGDVDAALALDGFDEYGAGLGIDGVLESGEVVVGDVGEAGDEGSESCLIVGGGGGGKGAEGSSVETFEEGDDFEWGVVGGGVGGGEASELDGGFVGFGAGVAEEGAAVESLGLEMLGEADLGLGVKLVAGGPEGVGLPGDGGDEGGVAVAEDGAAEAGEEIEIGVTVGVGEAGALSADESRREFAVVEDECVLMAGDQGSVGHGRARRREGGIKAEGAGSRKEGNFTGWWRRMIGAMSGRGIGIAEQYGVSRRERRRMRARGAAPGRNFHP